MQENCSFTHNRTGNTKFYEICGPVCGRVCRQYNSVGVIYNPITGESLNLPKLSLKGLISQSVVYHLVAYWLRALVQ